MEDVDLEKTAGLLLKNWDLERPRELDWETLKRALTTRLGEMLRDEFERLVQTMYRLDVSEPLFLVALDLPTHDARAAALANIVLERELLRIETWHKYSQG